MNDWEQLQQARPRLVRAGTPVEVGDAHPWDRGEVAGLPVLSALLARATVTPVTLGGSAPFEVLAWDGPTGRRGWLCRPARPGGTPPVLPLHRDLWAVLGGIVDVVAAPEHLNGSGADDTRWSENHQEVLTPVSAGSERFVSSLDAYGWIWEDADLEVPLDPTAWYVVAQEANGNLTVAHRETGQVLLFAPDHAYGGITELEGSPPYSLYTFDDAPDLAAWIELSAGQWT